MIDREDNIVRHVAWSDLFPWVSIFRSFRVAISLWVLLLAAAGLLLTLAGWTLFGWVFSAAPGNLALVGGGSDSPWQAAARMVPDRPSLPGDWLPDPEAEVSPAGFRDPIFGPWAQLTAPARLLLMNLELGVSGLAYLVLCGLWSLGVWGFVGGAITRMAAVQLASEERIGWVAAMRYAASKWPSYVGAPLLPMLGVLLLAVPVAVLGLFLRFGVGIFLAALVWPLALLAGLIMTVLLLGVVFGWPLMWSTISTEGSDSFDALSRSYAYVFQRPLHYLFYALVAAVLGALGWLLVSNFAAAVIWLAYWGASWGAGGAQVSEIATLGEELSGIAYAGAVVLGFWAGLVKLLAAGYLYGYFWVAATAIYLLLRRDVDATEMDEVYLDEDAGEQAFDLPPMQTDEAGAPVVADEEPTEIEQPDEKQPAEFQQEDAEKPPQTDPSGEEDDEKAGA